MVSMENSQKSAVIITIYPRDTLCDATWWFDLYICFIFCFPSQPFYLTFRNWLLYDKSQRYLENDKLLEYWYQYNNSFPKNYKNAFSLMLIIGSKLSWDMKFSMYWKTMFSLEIPFRPESVKYIKFYKVVLEFHI